MRHLPLNEDFARWRDDPITKLVFKALEAAAQAQKDQWDAASWHGGIVQAESLKTLLQELRVRADCYAALQEMTFEDIEQWLGTKTR